MTGESYFGYNQLAVAWLNHTNLKCIAPGETYIDVHEVARYNSGTFYLQKAGA